MSGAWFGGVVAVALTWAVGAGLVGCGVRRALTLSERLALGWLVGAVFSSCLLLAVGALGLGWNGLAFGAAHAFVAAACLAWNSRRAPGPTRPPGDADPRADATHPGRARPRSTRALRFALGLALLLGAAHTLREGTRFADSHAVWALRAKVIAEDGGFGGSYWREWSDAHDRRAYPPLLSLTGAWVHTLGPRADASTTKLVNLGFYLALVALVHAALSRRLAACAASSGALLFALSRPVLLGAGWGVADLPLAAYLLAALVESSRGRSGSRALLAACLAGAVMCKFEGVWIAGCVLLVAIVLRTQRRERWGLLACGLPALALVALWFALMARLDVPLEFGPRAAAPQDLDSLLARLGVAAVALLRSAWSPEWSFLVPLGLLASWRRRGAPRDLLLSSGTRVLLALLLVVLLVYAFQAGDTRALLATTLERLLLQLFPLAWVLGLCAWAGPPQPGDGAPST